MKLTAAYALTANDDRTVFEFISEGPKGRIGKLIELMAFANAPNATGTVYNLALGDRDANGQLDDQPVTNNGDTQRILLTVAAAIAYFTDQHPGAVVYAEGGTPARTRLYQMGIARNLPEIQAVFYVEGLFEGHWDRFRSGVTYNAFLIRRKTL